MIRRLMLAAASLVLAGCHLFPARAGISKPDPTFLSTPAAEETQPLPSSTTAERPDRSPTPKAQFTQTREAAGPRTGGEPAPTASPTAYANNILQVDFSRPFGGTEQLPAWQPGIYSNRADALPIDLQAVANPEVIAGLTANQRQALVENGFTVMASGEAQFNDIHFSVAKQQGQPYYLTTDAAYHSLHVIFDELLKALEKESLRPQMIALTRQVLDDILAWDAAGTGLEEDRLLAAAYLGVALRLFDPQASLPAELEEQVRLQLEQIRAGGGQAQSVLIPNFKDDYSAYKPVGHYTGDSDLERYFQGMTWLGRVSFAFRSPDDPNFRPSRAPLIITQALRQAGEGAAAAVWKQINQILDFVIGPSDDAGPAELAGLMDTIYEPETGLADLADETKWQAFLAAVDSLPAPQIHSTFLNSTAELEAARDWRFMGQRFTFDASIFQNLIFDRVGTRENPRKLPSGLDVMAVFGSSAALETLEASGETEYANYPEQLAVLHEAAGAQDPAEWQNRFYSGWLYSFYPQVAAKGSTYPPYMRTPAWQYKELNSALGSWAELKHDTVLYAKMPEFLGGGGPPSSGPAPAYVEPNPEVFYRLAYIATELSTGLSFRINLSSSEPPEGGPGLARLISAMEGMSRQYHSLGDIAMKELAGEDLTEEDLYDIHACLGIVECEPTAYPQMSPVPVIAAVSGAEDVVLEAGVGPVDRIFVVVPFNGQLKVAQGGVFSYYEFPQPRSDRLTDEQWRTKLASGAAERPGWVVKYLRAGGEPAFVLAIRPGDWLIITEAGGTPPLNVRAQPSRSAAILTRLEQGTYIEVVDGPAEVDGVRWWKIKAGIEGYEGWVLENPEWFERAHGQ